MIWLNEKKKFLNIILIDCQSATEFEKKNFTIFCDGSKSILMAKLFVNFHVHIIPVLKNYKDLAALPVDIIQILNYNCNLIKTELQLLYYIVKFNV